MLRTDETNTIYKLAKVLAQVCDDQTIADLMNATLSIEQEESLDDKQVEYGEVLFDSLVSLRPDCVAVAQQS